MHELTKRHNLLEFSKKLFSVELQISSTNRNEAEKLVQHLKYSQKWLEDVLLFYEASGSKRFQSIKVREPELYESDSFKTLRWI